MIRAFASCLISGLVVGELWNGHGTQTVGVYLLLIALAWIGLSILATFGWVIFVELCARRSRASRPRRGDHPPAHAPRVCLTKRP